MNTDMPTDFMVGDGAGPDDTVLPFQVEPLDVRGRVVRLGPSLDRLLKRHAYPALVSRALAEAITLTALMGSALKLEGRFQLQTRTDGPISMIVVDFDAPDKLRAYAQFDADDIPQNASTAELLGAGQLALTIDQGGHMSRYQGIVEIDGEGLEAAAHQYFKQSEQIPTIIRIAVGEVAGAGGTQWRAGGVFVQFLPQAPERMRQVDLAPGDAPAGVVIEPISEDDAWTEARALTDSVEAHELLDPQLSCERLLYRLFHERGVLIYEAQPVVDACRCSQDRILQMLKTFSPQERSDMTTEEGKITVTCAFCSITYTVEPAEVAGE